MDDIVVTSVVEDGDLYLCAGTLLRGIYKAIILQIDVYGKISWRKTFGDDISYHEAHDIIALDDGFLVCGASEGIPSKTGGKDWKAYLLKTDKKGDRIWERTHKLKGNDCFYHAIEEEGFILLGEGKIKDGEKSISVMKTDHYGNRIWETDLCAEKDVLTGGMVQIHDGYLVVVSKDPGDGWVNSLIKMDAHGDIIWEKRIGQGMILDICSGEDSVYLTGEHEGKLVVISCFKEGDVGWMRSYSGSNGVDILYENGAVFVGGQRKEHPALYELDTDGELKSEHRYDCEGWIETMVVTKEGHLVFIHSNIPREHTNILPVNNSTLKNSKKREWV